MMGVPFTEPAPCGMPGCMATLTKSTSPLPPDVAGPPAPSASLTTSYAPALTPPVVMMRSASPAWRLSASRNVATSSPVIGAATTRAPASRTAAASITALDS